MSKNTTDSRRKIGVRHYARIITVELAISILGPVAQHAFAAGEQNQDKDAPLWLTTDELPGSNGTFRVLARMRHKEARFRRMCFYVDNEALALRCRNSISHDNGRTWEESPVTPDITANLPDGYRRYFSCASTLDPRSGRLIFPISAMDTLGLNPKLHEPTRAVSNYYLRYAVSTDQGNSLLFNERIIHTGDEFSEKHPFPEIYIGKNNFYTGDVGSRIVITKSGRILWPIQALELSDELGTITETPEGRSRMYVLPFMSLVLQGEWGADNRIEWTSSEPLKISQGRSKRGLCEPTLAQFPHGTLLMVMRGSNATIPDAPAHKWFSGSTDDGTSWSEVQPWTYSDGSNFFSPSSMSFMMRHSSGRVFWAGNICEKNAYGNNPRYPLVVGEVDPETKMLLKDSVLVLDAKLKSDEGRGRIDVAQVELTEDRETGDIWLSYYRGAYSYKMKAAYTIQLRLQNQ